MIEIISMPCFVCMRDSFMNSSWLCSVIVHLCVFVYLHVPDGNPKKPSMSFGAGWTLHRPAIEAAKRNLAAFSY